jgi:hypothetical protein
MLPEKRTRRNGEWVGANAVSALEKVGSYRLSRCHWCLANEVGITDMDSENEVQRQCRNPWKAHAQILN